MQHFFDSIWYHKHPAAIVLLPLSALFYLLSSLRRYWLQKCQPEPLTIPVIVVGNISVGGTGKTPLLIALVQFLQAQGRKPAVISRGYGGKAQYPYLLNADSQAAQSGDEPLLIYRRCHCPVVVSPDRLQAARYVIEHCDADVILSDDGLQHYALPRDIEIAVIDGQRGLGNRFCLPAGPLRETASRLQNVDFVVVNGDTGAAFASAQYAMQIAAEPLLPLNTSVSTVAPAPGETVHAVAGIGHPQRFYRSLQQSGYTVQEHSFADHHPFVAQDVMFTDNKPVVMTEKDAVKCMNFSGLTQHWYLPVAAQLPQPLLDKLLQQLQSLEKV